MNGFAFILNLFQVKQSKIAQKLGVSRAIVNNWVHGLKPLPPNRAKEIIEKIPVFQGIKLELFLKEALAPSEQLDLTLRYLQQTSEPIEIEETYIDEKGEEHTYTSIHYTNDSEISHLSAERRRLGDAERLIKDINLLLVTEDDESVYVNEPEYHLTFGDSNAETIERLINVLKSDNKEHQITLKILLHFFSMSFGYVLQNIPSKKQKFAEELFELLERHEVISSEYLTVKKQKKNK